MVSDSVIDRVLADYVAGNLSGPAHIAVESHLLLSRRNRGFVHDLEALAGHDLSRLDPIALPHHDDALAAIFAEVLEPRPSSQPQKEEVSLGPAAELPAPLREFLGCGLDQVRWKWVLPGIWNYRPSAAGNADAALVRVAAGKPIPTHTHRGVELILILRGGLTDSTGYYGAGDLSAADDELDHRPYADRDQDCICFAVNEGPLRFTGPIGRLFEKYIRPG